MTTNMFEDVLKDVYLLISKAENIVYCKLPEVVTNSLKHRMKVIDVKEKWESFRYQIDNSLENIQQQLDSISGSIDDELYKDEVEEYDIGMLTNSVSSEILDKIVEDEVKLNVNVQGNSLVQEILRSKGVESINDITSSSEEESIIEEESYSD